MKRLRLLVLFLPALALFFASAIPQVQAHSAYYHCHWRYGKRYCHGYKKKAHKPRRHCWRGAYGRVHCRYY